MAEPCYRISALFRQFDAELLVVQLETGHFFYFTPNTKPLLEFFESPRSFHSYVEAAGLLETESEKEYLRDFFSQLVTHRIFVKVDEAGTVKRPEVKYCRPALLRMEQGKLKDVALLCRISGPNTSESGT